MGSSTKTSTRTYAYLCKTFQVYCTNAKYSGECEFTACMLSKNTLREKVYMIKDSGERTQFETGAVRDMHEGKGRFFT